MLAFPGVIAPLPLARLAKRPVITEVLIKPFNEIDEQFAFDYGEDARTLAQWRVECWEYFTTFCASIGREPSETMPLVCQRFRCVYP